MFCQGLEVFIDVAAQHLQHLHSLVRDPTEPTVKTEKHLGRAFHCYYESWITVYSYYSISHPTFSPNIPTPDTTYLPIDSPLALPFSNTVIYHLNTSPFHSFTLPPTSRNFGPVCHLLFCCVYALPPQPGFQAFHCCGNRSWKHLLNRLTSSTFRDPES